MSGIPGCHVYESWRARSGAPCGFRQVAIDPDRLAGAETLINRFAVQMASSSGIDPASVSRAEYSTVALVPAGSQRYTGTPNKELRSIICRLVSANGEAPNSIPRVNVLPFHGGVCRL